VHQNDASARAGTTLTKYQPEGVKASQKALRQLQRFFIQVQCDKQASTYFKIVHA
jgi:hypothetical protein